MTPTSYPETASRRKTAYQGERTGLAIPSVSEPASYFDDLTAGGAVIHRRTRRPTATCNLIAVVAGLGQREMR